MVSNRQRRKKTKLSKIPGIKHRKPMPQGAHAGKMNTVPGSAQLALPNGHRLLQAVSMAEGIGHHDGVLDGAKTICIYVHQGWCFVNDDPVPVPSAHMFEFLKKSTMPIAHIVDMATEALRRCYCIECTLYASDDAPDFVQNATALQMRANVAKVNNIPLDGTESSEARIDALLRD